MAGIGCLAHHDALRLALTADVIGAMSLEAMLGTGAAFDEALIAARPHPGQIAAARHLRELLRDSEIWESHRADIEHRLQDAYSLRCMPQVHGAARDALAELERVLRVEINAATDNPLVLPSGEVVSGGNFHGEPLALALDYATMAVAELASISERRTARLVDAHLSGLPAFLPMRPGVESGLMIAHYTAAALVNELQTLAHPSSVDTIPTSANQEDHVSHGRHCRAPPARGGRPRRAGAGHRGAVRRAGPRLPRSASPRSRGRGGARRRSGHAVPHLDADRPPAPGHRRGARARPRRRPARQPGDGAARTPMPELEFALLDAATRSTTSPRRRSRSSLPDVRLLGAHRRRPSSARGRCARRRLAGHAEAQPPPGAAAS